MPHSKLGLDHLKLEMLRLKLGLAHLKLQMRRSKLGLGHIKLRMLCLKLALACSKSGLAHFKPGGRRPRFGVLSFKLQGFSLCRLILCSVSARTPSSWVYDPFPRGCMLVGRAWPNGHVLCPVLLLAPTCVAYRTYGTAPCWLARRGSTESRSIRRLAAACSGRNRKHVSASRIPSATAPVSARSRARLNRQSTRL